VLVFRASKHKSAQPALGHRAFRFLDILVGSNVDVLYSTREMALDVSLIDQINSGLGPRDILSLADVLSLLYLPWILPMSGAFHVAILRCFFNIGW
jgi:hypothetical protein